MIDIYQTKVVKLTGTDYKEVSRKARAIYKDIASKTKRKPYIRSAYFKKEKVFLDYFWQHLYQKNQSDRHRRLALYPCAIDLIENAYTSPTITYDRTSKSETLYRFFGISADKQYFVVQIREIGYRKNKHLISVFPSK